MPFPGRRPHTNVSTRLATSSTQDKLGLDLVRIRIAAVCHVVNSPGITTLCHEHLGGIVFRGVLYSESHLLIKAMVCTGLTYLACGLGCKNIPLH